MFNPESLQKTLTLLANETLVCALLYQNPSRANEPFALVSGETEVYELTGSAPGLAIVTDKRVTLFNAGTAVTNWLLVKQPTAGQFKLKNPATGTFLTGSVPGTAEVFDFDINESDKLEVLVSYEVGWSGYSRQTESSTSLTFNPATGESSLTFTNASFSNASGSSVQISHVLGILGGQLTIGNFSDTHSGYGLQALTATIADAQTIDVTYKILAEAY